jgi:hypothetical protein
MSLDVGLPSAGADSGVAHPASAIAAIVMSAVAMGRIRRTLVGVECMLVPFSGLVFLD